MCAADPIATGVEQYAGPAWRAGALFPAGGEQIGSNMARCTALNGVELR
jgi:hypothetical protein